MATTRCLRTTQAGTDGQTQRSPASYTGQSAPSTLQIPPLALAVGVGEGTVPAAIDPERYFIHDGDQIALQLDEDGEVVNRYLWGANVDQLLADEQISTIGSVSEVYWPMTDHLGTVRDIAKFVSGTAEVVQHRTYDSFGKMVDESGSEVVDELFGFTGRAYDEVAELQNNLHRWFAADDWHGGSARIRSGLRRGMRICIGMWGMQSRPVRTQPV